MGTLFRMKPVTAAVVLACASQSAQAFETIEFANGAALETRINMTYTLAARMEDRDPLLAAHAGSNDGNNNFDDGSLTSNRIAMLFDGKLSKALGGGQELGFVLSATAFADYAYQTSNDNDPGNGLPGPGFNPNGVNKKPRFNEFTSQARFYHGGYGRLLDTYVYGSWNIGETRLSARLGRQVVNWGEALFFPSIGLAQGPSDGAKALVPGTEVKEILLPEDQVSLSFEATPDWTLLAHWQFQFQETLAPAPGSYFNTSDSVGPGGRCLTPWTSVAPIPPVGFPGYTGCAFGTRGDDILPSDTGQWGVGTRYRITSATELGLYYLNYSDRIPVPEINAFTPGPFAASPVPALRPLGSGSYRVRYAEDVELIGATASTSLGLVSVAAEVSYKDNAPVLVNTLVNPAAPNNPASYIPNPTEGKLTQVNLNAIANFGRTRLAPMTILTGEIAYVHVGTLEARKAPGVENLPPAFQAAFPASDVASFDTDDAFAVAATGSFSYPNFVEGWDLGVTLAYSQQIEGRTLTGGVGGEGDQRYSVGFNFTRLSNLQLGLNWLGFLGDASTDLKEFRALTDREQLSFTAKYSF